MPRSPAPPTADAASPARLPARWPRLLAALAGVALLLNATHLLALGLLHLGIALPLLAGLALLAWAVAAPRWAAWLGARPRWQRLWRWARAALLLWLISLGAFFVWLAQASAGAAPAQPAPQALIVLGSGTPHCQPSATLQARLNVAQAQAALAPGALLVLSGGANRAGTCTEAQVMAQALQAAGLPPERLLQEKASTSTAENLSLSAALLAAHGLPASAPVRVITSDFHLPRALAIARRAGFSQAQGVSAPTPLASRYNAWLREYFAYASGWLLGEY